jgi:hypothetical protein
VYSLELCCQQQLSLQHAATALAVAAAVFDAATVTTGCMFTPGLPCVGLACAQPWFFWFLPCLQADLAPAFLLFTVKPQWSLLRCCAAKPAAINLIAKGLVSPIDIDLLLQAFQWCL